MADSVQLETPRKRRRITGGDPSLLQTASSVTVRAVQHASDISPFKHAVYAIGYNTNII